MASKTNQQSEQEAKKAKSEKKIADFKRLANKRMTKLLKSFDGIKALTNRNAYTFDDTQSARIVTALEKAVAEVRDSFSKSTAQKSAGFEV